MFTAVCGASHRSPAGFRPKSGWLGPVQVLEVMSCGDSARPGSRGGFRNEERVATFGVQFAHSLVTALAAASLMLLAGLVLVRAVRSWSQPTGNGRVGDRLVLDPALAAAGEIASPIRPSAGVAAADAPTRAPPTILGAALRQGQDSPGRFRRLSE